MERYYADPEAWLKRTREYDRRRLYGMELGDYDAMLEAQGGVCAICGQMDEDRNLAVDHDHLTGVVRALLCKGCNMALGYLNDDPYRADAAARYLRTHGK